MSENEKLIKIIGNDNIIELRNHIEENNINIKDLNNINFDILIHAIEKDVSELFIEFLIINGEYRNLNYSFKEEDNGINKTPLSVALMRNNFKIADLLIEYGADFKYLNNDILGKIITLKNLKYILNKNIDINNLINILIENQKNTLLKYTFDNYIFNNSFILKLLSYYKKKLKLSNKDLNDIINNELNKIYFNSIYQLAFKFENYNALKIIYDNDRREKNVIFNEFYKKFNGDINSFKNKMNSKFNENLFLYDFNNYLIQKEQLYKLIKENNIKKLKKYILNNNIKLDNFNDKYDKNNDLLKYSIENEVSVKILNFIIEESHYEDLNYTICINGKEETLLGFTILTNKFQISDALIEKGANINNTGILNSINKNNLFNSRNFKYILNCNVNINPIFINELIMNNQINSLNILFKRFIYNKPFILKLLYIYKNKSVLSIEKLKNMIYNEKNKINFESSMYKIPINKDNYELLNIIFNNDNRNINIKLNEIFQLLNQEEKTNKGKKELYISKIKNKELLTSVDFFYINIINNLEKIKETIMKFIKNGNLVELDNYLIQNKINFSIVNNTSFDILIYSIKNLSENYSSIEMIKYIILRYKSLNYSICEGNRYLSRYNSPLSCALADNKFKFANLLLKNGANINYMLCDSDIVEKLYNDKALNNKNLKYILNNNYKVTSKLISTLTKEKKYYYLNFYSNKYLKTIFEHYIFDYTFITNILSIYKNKTPLTNEQLYSIINEEKSKIKLENEWYNEIIRVNNNNAIVMIFDNCGKELNLTQDKAFISLKKAVERNNYVFIEKYISYLLFYFKGLKIEEFLSKEIVRDNLYVMKFIIEKLMNDKYFDFKNINFERILLNLKEIKNIDFIKSVIEQSLDHKTFDFKYYDFSNVLLIIGQFNNTDLMKFTIEKSLRHKTFNFKNLDIKKILLIITQINTDSSLLETFINGLDYCGSNNLKNSIIKKVSIVLKQIDKENINILIKI